MDESIVSVIVITYNTGEAVLETLESIKNQTFQNIELIVSDDASIDDTVSIAKQWVTTNEKRFINAKVLTSKCNQGITRNINKGVYASVGKYVKIIGDDILSERAIEILFDAYENKNEEKVIWCPKMSLFAEKNADMTDMKNFISKYSQFLKLPKKNQIVEILKKNPIAAPAVEFFSKEMIKECDLYDEDINYIEDWTCWIKLAEKGFVFKEIDYVAVNYRVTQKSTSRNTNYRSNYYKDYANLYFKLRMRLLWKYKCYERFFKDLLKCLYIRMLVAFKNN